MNTEDIVSSLGFTLAEIVVSILLLSILTIGSFKTFHFTQSSTNLSLLEFQQQQLEQRLFILNKLKQTYSTINTSTEFESLKCLIESEAECP